MPEDATDGQQQARVLSRSRVEAPQVCNHALLHRGASIAPTAARVQFTDKCLYQPWRLVLAGDLHMCFPQNRMVARCFPSPRSIPWWGDPGSSCEKGMMTAKQRLQWTEEVHHLGASKTHLDDSTTLERRSTPLYANTTLIYICTIDSTKSTAL